MLPAGTHVNILHFTCNPLAMCLIHFVCVCVCASLLATLVPTCVSQLLPVSTNLLVCHATQQVIQKQPLRLLLLLPPLTTYYYYNSCSTTIPLSLSIYLSLSFSFFLFVLTVSRIVELTILASTLSYDSSFGSSIYLYWCEFTADRAMKRGCEGEELPEERERATPMPKVDWKQCAKHTCRMWYNTPQCPRCEKVESQSGKPQAPNSQR